MKLFLVVALSYLIGSISPSILLGKILKGIDIRKHGSGNAGATNALRVLGRKAGIIVLLTDILKGFIVIKLALYFSPVSYLSTINFSIVCGISVITGHVWTIFHSFKGGKGVNTATGVLLGLMPLEIFAAALIFMSLFTLTGYVSLGAILSSISLPLIIILRKKIFHHSIPNELLVFTTFIPILIIFTHRANIKRLIQGKENRSSLFRR